MTSPTPTPAPASRSDWSTRAIVSFALVLLVLTTIGLVALLHRPPPPSGLPSDPAAAAARAVLGDRLEVDAGDLRFATSFDDPAAELPTPEPDSARMARIGAAMRWLEEGQARHRLDPRFPCLLGHLELAADRLERAERRYRAALLLSPRYGEARLGLGVALARRSQAHGDERTSRALALASIAQFAAVEEDDPFHLMAAFDRVWMLASVGRMAEARALTGRYATLDPGSMWTALLLRRVTP